MNEPNRINQITIQSVQGEKTQAKWNRVEISHQLHVKQQKKPKKKRKNITKLIMIHQ